MVKLRRENWVAAKHALRYLTGSVDYGLYYRISDAVRLIGFTDSDWEGSVADQNITSRCCFSLGSATVSWFSRKQKYLALSCEEVEYMAVS